jgi:thymidylate kinase
LVPADQVIFIDIPVEESFRRKGKDRDHYEKNHQFLETVYDIYTQAAETLGWIKINGQQAPEKVHQDILDKLLERVTKLGGKV